MVVISQQYIPPDALTDVSSALCLLKIVNLWILSVLLRCFVALLPSVIVTEQTGSMS